MSGLPLGELSSIPLAFAALMPVVNPFGTALIMLGMVGQQSPATFRALAGRVALLMIASIVVLQLAGHWMLQFFGISMPVLQLAGGLTLAAMGWRTLASGGHEAAVTSGAQAGASKVLDGAFYPYTFPLTVGPGTIVVVLTLSAHATRPTLGASIMAQAGVLIGAVLLSLLVYACYRYAPWLERKLPPSAINGIQQLMAFLLLCIGTQIAWGGVSGLLKTLGVAAGG